MEIARVKDVMIPLDQYPHVPHWFTIGQTLEKMSSVQFDVGGRKSLPRVALVFNEAYDLLGMVRRRDILRGLDPAFLASFLRPRGRRFFAKKEMPLEVRYQKIVSGIRLRIDRPVTDVMSPIRGTIQHDDTLIRAIYTMVYHDVSIVPVLENQEVVGVVRTVELVLALEKLLKS
jgi:CBS domain-containing protein